MTLYDDFCDDACVKKHLYVNITLDLDSFKNKGVDGLVDFWTQITFSQETTLKYWENDLFTSNLWKWKTNKKDK